MTRKMLSRNKCSTNRNRIAWRANQGLRRDLQEAFIVPGAYAFRVYGYGILDPLEGLLAPGYFDHGSDLLCPGDLIHVSMRPPEGRGAGRTPRGPGDGAARRAETSTRCLLCVWCRTSVTHGLE